MAFLAKNEDDDNTQKEGASGFYNLSRWMDANKGSSQVMGGQIADQVKDANTKFQNNLNSAGAYDVAGSAKDWSINNDLYKANQVNDLASSADGRTQLLKDSAPSVGRGGINLNSALVSGGGLEPIKKEVNFNLNDQYRQKTDEIQARIDNQLQQSQATTGGASGFNPVSYSPSSSTFNTDSIKELIAKIPSNKTPTAGRISYSDVDSLVAKGLPKQSAEQLVQVLGGAGGDSTGTSGTGNANGAPSVGLTADQAIAIGLAIAVPSPVSIANAVSAIAQAAQAQASVNAGVADSNADTNGAVSNAATATTGPSGTGGAAANAASTAAANASNAGHSAAAIGAASQAAASATVNGLSPEAAAAAAVAAAQGVDGPGGDGSATGDSADGTAGVGVGEGGIGSSGAGTAAGDAAGNSEGSGGAANGGGVGDSGDGGAAGDSGGGGGGGGKIICTMMNDFYGMPYNENKIWVKYAVTHLKPEHQIGYHKVFLPLVAFAKKPGYLNNKMRNMLFYIGKHRTIDIQAELNGTYRRPVHKFLRAVIEPTLALIGKLFK
jgi:hypothetical protein